MQNEPLLFNQIKAAKLNNKEELQNIIMKMQPLVKRYVRKLFFMEKEDATQELNLTLIEAIFQIKTVENEAMCLAYLHKSVVCKYFNLCKKNRTNTKLCNHYPMMINDHPPMNEVYNNIETSIDIKSFLKNKDNKQQKIILYYYLDDLGDYEIALKVGVSRQYVHRIKKKLLQNYYDTLYQKNNA